MTTIELEFLSAVTGGGTSTSTTTADVKASGAQGHGDMSWDGFRAWRLDTGCTRDLTLSKSPR